MHDFAAVQYTAADTRTDRYGKKRRFSPACTEPHFTERRAVHIIFHRALNAEFIFYNGLKRRIAVIRYRLRHHVDDETGFRVDYARRGNSHSGNLSVFKIMPYYLFNLFHNARSAVLLRLRRHRTLISKNAIFISQPVLYRRAADIYANIIFFS